MSKQKMFDGKMRPIQEITIRKLKAQALHELEDKNITDEHKRNLMELLHNRWLSELDLTKKIILVNGKPEYAKTIGQRIANLFKKSK